MMFLVEAANTVKRYSAFPKTITSNPKSHFVFGVLPIAHIHLLQVVVGRKMMTRRQQISSLSNMPLPTIKFVFGWNSQHIHLAMETLACSPILFSNLQDRSWKKNSSVSSVELQRVMLYTILHILRTGFMYGICLPTYTIKINQM